MIQFLTVNVVSQKQFDQKSGTFHIEESGAKSRLHHSTHIESEQGNYLLSNVATVQKPSLLQANSE